MGESQIENCDYGQLGLTQRCGAARRRWIPLLHDEGNIVCFILYIVSLIIELTFDRCANSTKSRAIFHNFTRKRTFRSCFWNGSTENSEKMIFGYLLENVAYIFRSLWLLSSALEKVYIDPAIQIHPLSKTMLSGFTCSFSGTKLHG